MQVIGVPDEKYGEEIMAWVKLREGQAATVEEIRDFCRGKIAHYKVPRYVRFVDAFPMTVTGKVQKFVMREESVDAAGPGEGRRHQDGVDGSSVPQPERAHQRQRVRGAHHARTRKRRKAPMAACSGA